VNGLGAAALAVGAVALVLAFTPPAVAVAMLFALAGLVLGIVGITRVGRKPGTAIAGSAVSAFAFLVSVAVVVVIAVTPAADGLGPLAGPDAPIAPGPVAPDDEFHDGTDDVILLYQLGGDSPAVSGSISTDHDGALEAVDFDAVSLPFVRQFIVTAEQLRGHSVYTISASTGEGGGALGCRIALDGVVVAEDRVEGQNAVVECTVDSEDLD
jgi:hypothetical protein